MSRAAAATAALALFAVACSGGRPRGPMSDGERMYLAKCTSCHSAYEPGEKTQAKWRESLAEMERLKKVHLSDEQRALILGYLVGDAHPVAAPSPAIPPPPPQGPHISGR